MALGHAAHRIFLRVGSSGGYRLFVEPSVQAVELATMGSGGCAMDRGLKRFLVCLHAPRWRHYHSRAPSCELSFNKQNRRFQIPSFRVGQQFRVIDIMSDPFE